MSHRNTYLGTLTVLTALAFAFSGVARAAEMTSDQQKAQLALVPDGAKPIYEGFWHTTELYRMPDSWKPHKAPWQFCYNESYQGNTWRSDVLAELQKQVAAYGKAGLSRGDLIVTNSNGDTDTQLSQLNSLVAQRCDVIFSYPTSPTGLCTGIRDAAQKGILFITLDDPVLCPEAINIAENGYEGALDNARWLISAMGGKGRLLVVQGFAGTSLTVAWDKAIDQAVSENPGIKKVGEVHGNWTASVAKTETLKFIATHPQQINGIWSGGLMALAAEEALIQSGRKPVPTSDMDNECNWLAFMKQNPNVATRALVDGGGPVAYEAFAVATRLLAGRRLAVNTIMYKLPIVDHETIDQYYDPSMTLDSTCWANPKDGRLVSDAYLDQFFTGNEKLPVQITP
jgi:ribose transport system substrate-binding protein